MEATKKTGTEKILLIESEAIIALQEEIVRLKKELEETKREYCLLDASHYALTNSYDLVKKRLDEAVEIMNETKKKLDVAESDKETYKAVVQKMLEK